MRASTRLCAVFGIVCGLVGNAAAQPTARFSDVSPASATPSTAAPRKPPQTVQPANPPEHTSPAPASNGGSWSRRLAEHKLRRGELYEQRGETSLAVRAYTEAIAYDRTFGPAYLKLGGLRELMGDIAEADLLYSQATALDDVRALSLVKRALVRRRVGRHDEAVRDLQAAVEMDSAPEAIKTLAAWHVERRDWPAALAAWRRLLTLAARNQNLEELAEAELQVQALTLLAADADAVTRISNREHWVRKALASIAQHAPGAKTRRSTQPGVRKLAP